MQIIDKLDKALENGYAEVFVATHVPPIGENPYYVNYVFGEMLKQIGKKYPDQNITVLSGHTHRSLRKRIHHNVDVYVSGSDYRETVIRRIEL